MARAQGQKDAPWNRRTRRKPTSAEIARQQARSRETKKKNRTEKQAREKEEARKKRPKSDFFAKRGAVSAGAGNGPAASPATPVRRCSDAGANNQAVRRSPRFALARGEGSAGTALARADADRAAAGAAARGEGHAVAARGGCSADAALARADADRAAAGAAAGGEGCAVAARGEISAGTALTRADVDRAAAGAPAGGEGCAVAARGERSAGTPAGGEGCAVAARGGGSAGAAITRADVARGEENSDAAPPEKEGTNAETCQADASRESRGEGDTDAARIAADGLVCLGSGGRAAIRLDAGTGGCASASEENATPQGEEDDVPVIINSAVHRSVTPNDVTCNLDLDEDDEAEEEQLDDDASPLSTNVNVPSLLNMTGRGVQQRYVALHGMCKEWRATL